ncbi:MAG: alanine--tRNA ligase [Lachnospiraceae bacterium]|nr:alanine--tRNA ligase [Lachnospiraceae bacterium]
MKSYGVNQLRKLFLDFFASKGHLVVKSYSLVPHNDKSLLLINSGMAPMKSYFTGQETPPNVRIVTCQKCIRTGDIENVGKTARHGTFFEMLGNFSFGDYFKEEAIAWSWEFLTETVGLDADRLYPSVYLEDDEAFAIWNKKMNIPATRIYKMGKEDNFWEHGAGPCGPCSEIYYDMGEKYGCGSPDCTVGCECDRYVEIWNNVFTQFESDGNGNYVELEQKNIDTGMGLERLAAAVQDVPSIFDVDTVASLREHVCQMAGVEYEKGYATDVSVRVIVDHVRSVSFMISDGIMPSNEGRGYVLRRLIRRACRHGRILGMPEQCLSILAKTVIMGSKDGYPELEEKQDFILKVIGIEEEQFDKTIDQGLSILNGMVDSLEKSGIQVLAGAEAFKLYDTYGFPLDLTQEILEEKQISVDMKGFDVAMEKQRKTARAAREETNYMGADVTVYESIDPSVTSIFVGYDRISHQSDITVLTSERALVDTLQQGETGTLFVQETPFYAANGGQEADTGTIETSTGIFVVEDVVHLLGGKIGHIGFVSKGSICVGDNVSLCVDGMKRQLSARNHSATHLLHKALKLVLGSHVEQAGSSVNAQRLRFDFTHFSALTADEITWIEKLVNDEIVHALAVTANVMPIEAAKKQGAQALFGEKYGDEVRVVRLGDFSLELCGGIHVGNTADIMAFKILSESGIAAGVRRMEAVTSLGLLSYYENQEKQLHGAAKLLKTNGEGLADKIVAIQKENKELHSEVDHLKGKMARASVSDVMDRVQEIAGVKLLAIRVENVEPNALRDLSDQLKDKLGEGVVVLASANGDKVGLLVSATDGAIKAGAHAGNLIKAIAGLVGGGGGGRPNMAQAGGKNPNGIEDALEKAKGVLMEQLILLN